MYLILLLIQLFILKFHFFHAASVLLAPIIISANTLSQTFNLDEGERFTILRIHEIRDDIQDGFCNATCTINELKSVRIDGCNVVYADGNPHINILIKEKVTVYFNGDWQCLITGSHKEDSAARIVQYPTFTIVVKKPDYSRLPELSLRTSKLFDIHEEFNITFDVDRNFTLNEGEQKVAMSITGVSGTFENGLCALSCAINGNITVRDSNCETTETQTRFVHAKLQSFKVTQAHSGQWFCKLELTNLLNRNKEEVVVPKFTVTVKGSEESTTASNTDPRIYIGVGVGVIVILLIIIGQTICILYFKAKARKAEIIRNLTPKNITDQKETSDVRYVKKTTETCEIVRESGIYEALETVRAIVPPPPPPIETMPGTLRPLLGSQSVSQSNLSQAGARTTPRPQPKNPQNPRKFNTVDRCSSFERIRNRPQQPLPTSEDIYEDVPAEASPQLSEANRLKTTKEMSALPAPKKKTLFGRSRPTPEPKQPPEQTRPETNSPHRGQKPPVALAGASSPGAGRGLLPRQNLPGSSRPLMLLNPGLRPPTGAMPVLQSMISSAQLKPVKQIPRPPVGEPKMKPGESSRITPARSYTNPASKPKPLLPSKPKPSMHVPLPIEPEPQSSKNHHHNRINIIPPIKLKPPMPVPVPSETSEPTDYPESYYGTSSDEEFDCYDVLPDYRIYGNAPPKKIT